jgi:hypothetical protein
VYLYSTNAGAQDKRKSAQKEKNRKETSDEDGVPGERGGRRSSTFGWCSQSESSFMGFDQSGSVNPSFVHRPEIAGCSY